MFLPMRPRMALPNRAVERATREHGRAEDRRGPQRRAELIGPAPSNLVSPTIERLVDLSDPLIFSRAKLQLEVGASLRRVSYDEVPEAQVR